MRPLKVVSGLVDSRKYPARSFTVPTSETLDSYIKLLSPSFITQGDNEDCAGAILAAAQLQAKKQVNQIGDIFIVIISRF